MIVYRIKDVIVNDFLTYYGISKWELEEDAKNVLSILKSTWVVNKWNTEPYDPNRYAIVKHILEEEST